MDRLAVARQALRAADLAVAAAILALQGQGWAAAPQDEDRRTVSPTQRRRAQRNRAKAAKRASARQQVWASDAEAAALARCAARRRQANDAPLGTDAQQKLLAARVAPLLGPDVQPLVPAAEAAPHRGSDA